MFWGGGGACAELQAQTLQVARVTWPHRPPAVSKVAMGKLEALLGNEQLGTVEKETQSGDGASGQPGPQTPPREGRRK